eukprot:6745551-Ditylum_brightwellii.AAC.1
MYASAAKWQEDITRLLPISRRGLKLRSSSAFSSGIGGEEDNSITESIVELYKLDRLANHKILTK